MNDLLSSGLWDRLIKLGKTARKKSAAVAYVTDGKSLVFGKGDILITDASDGAIMSGQTNATVLAAAYKRGAEIFSIAGLHSKVYVFDKYAIIGSANLSKKSKSLTEAALFTDQPTVVSATRVFVDNLKKTGKAVDKPFIARISKLPVTKTQWAPSGANKTVDAPIPRTWLVGLKPVQPKEDEQQIVEQGMEQAESHLSQEGSSVSWIRIRGNSLFRREAKAGDLVVCIWTENGDQKPSAVYHHTHILLRKDDAAHDRTWFYIEEYPDAEETKVTWKRFQKLYSQLEISGKLGQWTTREIALHQSDALHDLWLK